MPSPIEPHGDGATPAAARPNFMALHGARLVEQGWPVIPIMPGSKAPGRYSPAHGWWGYKDWSRHCERPTTQNEVEVWSRWPGCGVGVACGSVVVGVDLDVLDPEAAMACERLAREVLGDTPALRVGLNPKRTLLYRPAAPFRPIKLHPIEVLATGNQLVAYAIHPDTGRPYTWPMDELIDLAPDALPVVTQEQARAFAESALDLVPPELRQGRLPAIRNGERYYAMGGDPRGTGRAVAVALSWVPNDDLARTDWVKVGMAIKGALGEGGLPLWLGWSAGSAKSGKSGRPDTALRTWRSLKPDRIGAGSLYEWAMDAGWVPEGGLVLNGGLEEAMRANPGAGLVAAMLAKAQPAAVAGPEADTPAPPPGAGELPFVAEAPGLLGELTRWMTATAVSPQPFLSLGAAVVALGVAMGRRYRLEAPDTRSNVYVIALADSGGGKDHPRKCVRRLFGEAGLGAYLGGETLASGSALLSSVAAHPCRLFQIDEIGHFVQAVLDPKSHAAHRREIMTNLTTLWSSASETVIGTEYANQRERPRQDIVQPCVGLYGSSVPDPFWKSLQSGNVGDGSVARFLIVQAERSYPDEQDPEPLELRLPPLVARLKALAAGDGGLGSVMAPSVAPLPLTVEMDGGGEAADRDLRRRHLEMKRKHEGTPFSAIVARHREHVRRLALIAAVAVDHEAPVVTAAVYGWAEAVVGHCLATLMDQAERYVADSEHEATCKRVLEIVRRHGGWMDGRTLARRTQWLPRKVRAEVIAGLVEADFFEISHETTATKPKILIRAVKRADDLS